MAGLDGPAGPEAEPDEPVGCELAVERLGAEAGCLVFSIRGEIDISSVERLEAALAPALAGRPGRIVFELGELAFMDSSGLAFLLRLAHAGIRVELRNPTPAVRRTVEVTGLGAMLHLAP